MLWPLLVEYNEPGPPEIYQAQQQGNLALFLTIFIFTVVEVLIVKVSQAELTLLPHDPPYGTESDGDSEPDLSDDDGYYGSVTDCRVRAALQEEEHRKSAHRCISCGRTFNPSATPPIICAVCGHRACFDLPCSRPAAIGWNCIVCHTKRTAEAASKDVEEIAREIKRRRSSTATTADTATIDRDSVQVREYIEQIVEKIIGGSMDEVPVGKLTQHTAYQELFGTHHQPLSQALAQLGSSLRLTINSKSEAPQETSSAQSALSHLIEKIAEEAARLPNLNEPSQQAQAPSRISPLHDKSYEDILSTAILNKIITKYQQKNGQAGRDSNSNILSRSQNGTRRRNSEEDVLDSDWSDYSTSEPVAIKVEERIEEVTTAYESSSDDLDDLDEISVGSRRVPFPEYGVDIVDAIEEEDVPSETESTDVLSNPSTWEENWLFQRKKLKRHHGHNPVPVPMLVPNPSQDFRALIGGVDADDISDLSECSDSVLEEAMSEYAEDAHKAMEIIDKLNDENKAKDSMSQTEDSTKTTLDEPDSAETQISPLDSYEADTQTVGKDEVTDVDEDSGIQPLTDEEDDVMPSLGDEDVREPPGERTEEDVPCPSPPSLTEQDRDVPIEFDSAQQITRPPVPKPRRLETTESVENSPIRDDEPMVCSIAEREKAKWNNAIEMKNNPYTPENIAKRTASRSLGHLSRMASNESIEFPVEGTIIEDLQRDRKYSRDYYVKSSRSPTGDPPARTSDSPLSFKSEASLEEEKIVHAKPIQVCEELPNHLQTNTVTNQPEPNLPNVGELKKNFLAKKPPIPTRSPPRKQSKESVKKIVKALSIEQPEQNPHANTQDRIFVEVEETRRASLTKESEKVSSSQSESEEKVKRGATEDWLSRARKPVKPVHSLTARSLSKDFREGLKIKPRQASAPERIPEIYSDDNSLQKLNFDVKGKKTFWENIAKMK